MSRAGGALLVVLASVPVAAGLPPPAVRFLEIGEQGTVFTGALNVARVRIEAGASGFAGRFEAGLAPSSGVWRGSTSEVFCKSVDIGAGGAETFDALFTGYVHDGTDATVQWRLIGRTGAIALEGNEPVRASTPDSLRLLSIGSAPPAAPPPWLVCFARASAHREAWRYQPFAIVATDGATLAALARQERLALFDAVCRGMTLVVTPPSTAVDPEIDGSLASDASLVWEGPGGAFVREVPWLLGCVRTTSLDLSAAGPDGICFGTRLALSPRAIVRQVPSPIWSSATLPSRRRDTETSAGLAIPLAGLFIGSTAFFLASSARRARSAGLGIAASAAILSPFLVHGALSRIDPVAARVIVREAAGSALSVRDVTAEEVRFTDRADRVRITLERVAAASTVTGSQDPIARVEPAGAGITLASSDRAASALVSLTVIADGSPLVEERLTNGPSGLTGRVDALRDLRDLVVVTETRTIALGDLRAGESATLTDRTPRASAEVVARLRELGALRVNGVAVVAASAGPAPVPEISSPGRVIAATEVHVRQAAIEAPRALLTVPAEPADGSLVALVPDRLLERFVREGEGIGVRATHVAAPREIPSRDGFRAIPLVDDRALTPYVSLLPERSQ